MKKLKKRVLTIILVIFIVFTSVFVYAGCSFKYELIELQDAYEQGLIDYDDLLNIAYYGGYKVFNQGVIDDANFVPKNIGELSNADEMDIIKSLLSEYKKKNRKLKFAIENFEISSYFGVYNDYVAFDYKLKHKDLASLPYERENVVSGLKFGDIYLWKKL